MRRGELRVWKGCTPGGEGRRPGAKEALEGKRKAPWGGEAEGGAARARTEAKVGTGAGCGEAAAEGCPGGRAEGGAGEGWLGEPAGLVVWAGKAKGPAV